MYKNRKAGIVGIIITIIILILIVIFSNGDSNLSFFENVASNLVDKTNSGVSPLVEPMKNLMSRNDAIGSSIYMRIQEIALFIDGQVKEYNVSTEDAKASLVKLISLIQTSLGKNAGDSVTTTVDDPEIFGDTIGAGNGNSEPIAGSGVENLERLNPLPSFRKMVKIE